MPSKGKAKETQQWKLSWWDAQALSERDLRPLAWSKSSVIFSAHPNQPLVTARHFSSSKQFKLQSPAVIEASSGAYSPPNLISVDPDDGWLFAFFPGREAPGVGCLWRKGTRIDDWNIQECWSFNPGAGVVAASWLGTARQYIPHESNGRPKRLPTRGPNTPVSGPTLLLVTQNYSVQVHYLRQYLPAFKSMTCSIQKGEITAEARPEDNKPATTRICTRAAIGLHYNENSILIATRSFALPAPTSDPPPFENLDSNVSDVLQPQLSDMGIWGEESTIEITEVHLNFNGVQMTLATEPLAPLTQLGGSITKLEFISTPRTNAATSPGETHFYLAASFLDFLDFTSTPKSSLTVHSIFRQSVAQQNRTPWIFRQLGSRSFFPQLLVFSALPVPRAGPVRDTLYVGLANSSGNLPQTKSESVNFSIGEIKSLLLPDLSDDAAVSSFELVIAMEETGLSIPIQAAMSPNGALLATLSSSLFVNMIAIQQIPRPNRTPSLVQQDATHLPPAIISRTGTADLIHQLSQTPTTLDDTFEMLYQSLRSIQGTRKQLSHVDFLKYMGAVHSVYKQRQNSSKKPDEQEHLGIRAQVSHDMCSLVSCTTAFEDLREGDKYDLDAVWQLIALATWVVTFCQKVVKECVLFSEPNDEEALPNSSSSQTSISPTLLYLVHPHALQLFVTALNHIKQFHTFINSLSANAEAAQIARDVLLDLVDGSSLDFATLTGVLNPALKDAQSLSQESCMKALARCQPTLDMWPLLLQNMKKVTDTTITNKCTLFIQVSDLMDENTNTTLATKSARGRDVILKRALSGLNPAVNCLQCGGASEVQAEWAQSGQPSPRWHVWERNQRMQCVCGGDWTSARNPTSH